MRTLQKLNPSPSRSFHKTSANKPCKAFSTISSMESVFMAAQDLLLAASLRVGCLADSGHRANNRWVVPKIRIPFWCRNIIFNQKGPIILRTTQINSRFAM